MKRLFSTLALAAFLAAGNVNAADEVAFIDLQEVFKQFYKTQLAQDQMRQQADNIKMEREEIETEIAAMKEEIEALRADSRDETLSDEVRASKRDLLEEKLVDLQKKEQEMVKFGELRMKQLDQQNQRRTKMLIDEIYDAVINYAKVQDYATVIDRSAQSRIGTDVVLYTSPKVDITADVLAVLNKGRESAEVEESKMKVEE